MRDMDKKMKTSGEKETLWGVFSAEKMSAFTIVTT